MSQANLWTPDRDFAAPRPAAGGTDELVRFAEEKIRAVEEYARVNPVNFGLWMFGIGFVLGWKLKPW